MRAVKHHSCNLLYRKTGSKILRPFLSRQPPVLVWIEAAVAVEVLEGIAVIGQNADPGTGSIAERLSSLLGYQVVAVLCLCLAPARSAACAQHRQKHNHSGISVHII